MKDSRYVYDGTGGLSEHVVNSVRDFMKTLPYMVEVVNDGQQHWAKRILPWINKNVAEITVNRENDWGGSSPHTYRPYGVIQKDMNHMQSGNYFLCFLREPERKAFVENFGPYIVNAEPFKTIV